MANFQKGLSEKPDSARVSHNFQKFSDLGQKKHVCWINHYFEHDTTSFLSNFQKFSDLGHKKHVCWINHYIEHDTTSFLSNYYESDIN